MEASLKKASALQAALLLASTHPSSRDAIRKEGMAAVGKVVFTSR
jgi:hypothetical protein